MLVGGLLGGGPCNLPRGLVAPCWRSGHRQPVTCARDWTPIPPRLLRLPREDWGIVEFGVLGCPAGGSQPLRFPGSGPPSRRIHYPLPLPYQGKPDPVVLQGIIRSLKEELGRLRGLDGQDARDSRETEIWHLREQ